MATMSYKCPNCDGPLKFDPDKQKFTCEFCLGEFAPDQVQQMNEEKEQRETYDEQEVRHAEQQQQQAKTENADEDFHIDWSLDGDNLALTASDGRVLMYRIESLGADSLVIRPQEEGLRALSLSRSE